MIAMAMALLLDLAVAPIVVGRGGVLPDDINVDFSATPTAGEAPLHVRFTDETTIVYTNDEGGIPLHRAFARLANVPVKCDLDPDYTRLWEFGDGATSTDANPTHVYRRAGEYTVTLTVFFNCLTTESILPLDALLPCGTVDQPVEPYTASETKELYITIYQEEAALEGPEPAKMVVAYLDISPQEVVQGQELEISVNLCNRGGEKGSRNVALMINGHSEQSQTVVVSPGSCQTMLFRTFKTVPGSYEVWVEGATGSFSVMPLFPGYVVREAPPTKPQGLGTAGIVTIVIVLIVLGVGLVLILRR